MRITIYHRMIRIATATVWLLMMTPLYGAEVQTVAQWDFSSEETTQLQSHGGVFRDQLGPRPPMYPEQDAANLAVRFDGNGARYVFRDPGEQSAFDFTNGDAITLQASLRVDSIGRGQNRYVIGKGRTQTPGFQSDNQNWALRIREQNGKRCVSFLFATARNSGNGKSSHWHRWTTDKGLPDDHPWHSIAVSYRFGNPDSMRAWINGEPQSGQWDMGGATQEPPVVDDDAVWIGSSMGGSPASSFRGWIDSLAIHRGILTDAEMAKRYRRASPLPAAAPIVSTIAGKVRVEFDESIDSHRRWPDRFATSDLHETETKVVEPMTPDWITDQFLFPRLPYRYDDFGIRSSWNGAVMVSASADVPFPAGDSRILLRARGLSRLWVGEKSVVQLKPLGGSTDGHQPVLPLPAPPAPGMRIVGYGLQEGFGQVTFDQPTTVRVVLETIVGGPKYRSEPGEMMVAIQPPGADDYSFLLPAKSIKSPRPMTDSVALQTIADVQVELQEVDRQTRTRLAEPHDRYWNQRHDAARSLVDNHVDQSLGIDHLIFAKIVDARTKQSEAKRDENGEFADQVLPILRDRCFRCHDESGEGGLQLTSRQSMLVGGDSGVPSIVLDDPKASALIKRIISDDEHERMPPSQRLSKAEVDRLTKWITNGAHWGIRQRNLTQANFADDESLLRRVYLDTIGVPPNESQIRDYLLDDAPDKYARLIQRLLNAPGWADHWVSYWQDVLGENPNLLKPSLNNTGPFRWFLHESLADNKPIDRMATELLMLRGSEREGGSAGFGMAAENDAPFAARSVILASAFLGANLQCARCHDSPYHSTTQRQLFSLSAMLARRQVTVPPTSTVAPGFFQANPDRKSLIQVTLKPGEPVLPAWPFESLLTFSEEDEALIRQPEDSRERLTVAVTSPRNQRFANVIVNRLWKRLIGTGIVEPIDDWENANPSHPELLRWLSAELIRSGYDMKHIVGLVMNSDLYRRQPIGANLLADADDRLFLAPDRRRLTAEQIVDSMVTASGRPLDVGEITFDPEAKRPAKTMISLGSPSRAWMFATISNERDRPSLAFPRATAVIDVLKAFGWTGSRQSAINQRETEPNVLQPGAIGNGVFASWTTTASDRSELAELAVKANNARSLIESIYLRFLCRFPTDAERAALQAEIEQGFDDRLCATDQIASAEYPPELRRVSWSNHLAAEANRIKIIQEQRAVEGDPKDPRLESNWRQRYEDVVWSVLNSPEFVWVP